MSRGNFRVEELGRRQPDRFSKGKSWIILGGE